MNDEQLHCLRAMIEYIKESEKKHYEESGEPSNHVYAQAMKVEEWLNSGED